MTVGDFSGLIDRAVEHEQLCAYRLEGLESTAHVDPYKRGSSKRFEDFSRQTRRPKAPVPATGADAGAPLAAPVTAGEGHSDLA
jgi:hypothetical protein